MSAGDLKCASDGGICGNINRNVYACVCFECCHYKLIVNAFAIGFNTICCDIVGTLQ